MKEFKLIRVYLEKKNILPFRIMMLVASWPFLVGAFEVAVSGSASLWTHVATRGEDWGYYTNLIMKATFALFFLWLGTFGTRDIVTVGKDWGDSI